MESSLHRAYPHQVTADPFLLFIFIYNLSSSTNRVKRKITVRKTIICVYLAFDSLQKRPGLLCHLVWTEQLLLMPLHRRLS